MEKDLPLEDCAIEVVVNYDDEPPRFRFKRLPSHGKYHNAITFRQNEGRIGVYLSRRVSPGHLFTISFWLRPDDTSGGFAGIKIWPVGGIEPSNFFLPGRGVTEKIVVPPAELNVSFILEVCYTSDKATMLKLGDPLSVSGEYHYCLGIYRNKERKDQIDQHDPQIYNTGDIGDGDGGLLGITKAFLRRVFGR